MAKTNVFDTDPRLDDLELLKVLKERNSIFLPNIIRVYDATKDLLNTRIPRVFPNYTLHNVGHSFRIMKYMAKLVSDVRLLDDLEITLLIFSALLHDIGMAVSEERIDAIKEDRYKYNNVKFSSMKKYMEKAGEEVVLEEYVRQAHAAFSAIYIREHHAEEFAIPKLTTLSFADELALICESHNRDYDFIKRNLKTYEVRGDYHFNAQFIACILRLADILDIDSNRTPYRLYKIINPKGVSDAEWRQHFVVENNDKIVYNEKTRQKRIEFHGRSLHSGIHRKLLTYIQWVENELAGTCKLTAEMAAPYQMMYETKPEVVIETMGYSFSDDKLHLEFNAVTELLMGDKIYGAKSLGLRELIQNSMDACKVREEIEEKRHAFGREKYQPKIKVFLDEDKNQVSIIDNGTGMSLDVVRKYFLTIGASYYASPGFRLQDYKYKPIGNFGIGFLSCFMLSDTARVITRHFASGVKCVIDLERGSEHISLTESEDVLFEGTEIILNYTSFMNAFQDNVDEVVDFIREYFITDGITIEVFDMRRKNRYVISNPLDQYEQEPSVPYVKVDLGKYVKGMEGYAILRRKKIFVRGFADLDFDDERQVFKYDQETASLTEVDDEMVDFQLDDYLLDDEMKSIAIPIVHKDVRDDYLTMLTFSEDDVYTAVEKMNGQLLWISILADKKFYDDIKTDATYDHLLMGDDRIFDKLFFKDLASVGHELDCPTMRVVGTFKLFEGKKNTLYMPFETGYEEEEPIIDPPGDDNGELFLRNIFIKNFTFKTAVRSSVFEVKAIRLNVSSHKFLPDVSRNVLTVADDKSLNYIVTKALHVAASRELDYDEQERATLERFIHVYFSDTTEFEI